MLGDLPPNASFQYTFGTKEHEFVVTEIRRLLVKKVLKVSKHEERELVSPIFLRSKTDGDGFRIILNLKKPNRVSEYFRFKMDTLKSILTLVTPRVYMIKIDIEDAYYSVPIKQNDQKFLIFSIDQVLYLFMVPTNGYRAGPRKFTKLLNPALAALRKVGITLAAYLDDIIIFGRKMEGCRENLFLVLKLLQSLGFVIHPHKSICVPSKVIEFLGFIINSHNMTVTLTKDKKLAIKDLCTQLET